MNDFGEHARRGHARAETRPRRGLGAGFFDELTLRGVQRRLVRLELSRGQLPEPAAGGVTILAQQAHALLIVDRHGGCAAGMVHDLESGTMAVRKRHFVDRERDHAATEMSRAFQLRSIVGHRGSVTGVPDPRTVRACTPRESF